jgi:hypothetical protein
MGVSGQCHALAVLYPWEKDPGTHVPIGQDAGWASDTVWTQRLQEKCLASAGHRNLDHPVVQPVARHYTD